MAERTIEYETEDPLHVPQADFPELQLEVACASERTPRRRTGTLRRELSARNLQRAAGFAHEATYGNTPSILYQAADDRTHGNFFPACYRRILANAAWAQRLEKAYTSSQRVAHPSSRQRHELDCANSSDALLMNVFCHPAVFRSTRLKALLHTDAGVLPEFGVRARVPLRNGQVDRTEFDMLLRGRDGDLLVEAKLSETDFQRGSASLMARYDQFEETFAVDDLARVQGRFRSYQLLRCVLAADHLHARFAVVLDARRTDLVEDTFQVYRSVRDVALRSRLCVITWQEIAACVPRTLQAFLVDKYGIEAVR